MAERPRDVSPPIELDLEGENGTTLSLDENLVTDHLMVIGGCRGTDLCVALSRVSAAKLHQCIGSWLARRSPEPEP